MKSGLGGFVPRSEIQGQPLGLPLLDSPLQVPGRSYTFGLESGFKWRLFASCPSLYPFLLLGKGVPSNIPLTSGKGSGGVGRTSCAAGPVRRSGRDRRPGRQLCRRPRRRPAVGLSRPGRRRRHRRPAPWCAYECPCKRGPGHPCPAGP